MSMNPNWYRIESQEAGSDMWKDVFPGAQLARSEVQEHLDPLRNATAEYAQGRKFRVIEISETDKTSEFE